MNGPVPAQLAGAVMLIVGGVWLWGPLFLLVAGCLLVAGPEFVKFGPSVVAWARTDVPRAVRTARGVPR